MALKRAPPIPVAPVKKKTTIELMLERGEIIDMFRQRDEVQRLAEHLYFQSGEKHRTTRIMTPEEEIQCLQEEIDTEIAEQSFLPLKGAEDDYLGLPNQYLKAGKRLHKELIAKLAEFDDQMD